MVLATILLLLCSCSRTSDTGDDDAGPADDDASGDDDDGGCPCGDGPSSDAVPDVVVRDWNPNSPTYGEEISPRDYLGKTVVLMNLCWS